MKKILSIMVFSCICLHGITVAQQYNPPRALMLSRVIKNSQSIYIGKLISARKLEDGGYLYVMDSEISIIGGKSPGCMISKLPFGIGVDYVFFTSSPEIDGCADGGAVSRKGFELRKIGNKQYVVLSDDRYFYPNFGDDLLSVKSDTDDLGAVITLWSGIDLKKFISYVVKTKESP
jgi:hypothetical protein